MPKIAISYRRTDSDATGRIFDRLVHRYGKDSIFRDIDTIPFGIDFRKVVNDALRDTDVLIAIVGPNWRGLRDDGTARIELPESLQDFSFRNAAAVDSGRNFDTDTERLMRSIDRLLKQRDAGVEKVISNPAPRAQSSTKNGGPIPSSTISEIEITDAASRTIEGNEPSPVRSASTLPSSTAIVPPQPLAVIASALDRPAPQPETGALTRESRVQRPSRRAVVIGGTGSLLVLGGVTLAYLNNRSTREAPLTEPQPPALPPYMPPAASSAQTNPLLRTFSGHQAAISSVAISSDGVTALSGSYDTTLKVWDIATGSETRTLSAHSKVVFSVSLSPDGRMAVSGGQDTMVLLWDMAQHVLIRRFAGHSDTVFSVAFSPDGRTAISGGADNYIKLWDITTGTVVRNFTGHSEAVKSIAFSPDGRTAVSGSYDKTLKLWNIADGALIRTLSGHLNTVTSAVFSPDGQTVLSGSDDRTLKLWDIRTGAEIRAYSPNRFDNIRCVRWSPDGRTALSGGTGKSLRLWNISTGSEIRAFSDKGRIESLAFLPDGYKALSGSSDTTLNLWDLTVKAQQ